MYCVCYWWSMCYSQWERTRAVHVLRMLLVVHVLQPVGEDQGCACTAYVTGGPCVTASGRGPGLCMYCVCYWWSMCYSQWERTRAVHVLRILLVDHVTASKRGPGLCMYCVCYWWTMLQPVREDQGCACTAYVIGGPCYSQ